MQQELIINILGPNTLLALSTITACISKNNCNILDSRHALYGTDFSLSLIVNGNQASITRLEINLSTLCVEHDLLCMMKRTSGHRKQNIGQYVALEFTGADSSGVMQTVTETLSDLGVSVQAVRQKTRLMQDKNELVCKMILSAPHDLELNIFDTQIKALLNGMGLHGKIIHKHIKEKDEYIESW